LVHNEANTQHIVTHRINHNSRTNWSSENSWCNVCAYWLLL